MAKDAVLDEVARAMPGNEEAEEAALATVEEQSVQVSPALYQTEPTFDQEDLWVSKIRLAQGLTPEVQNGEAKPGQWVLTGMPANSGPEVVPLRFAKLVRRYGLVNGQRYVACNRHLGPEDEDCPNCRVQYQEELRTNPGFEATLENYYSYMVYVLDTDMPAILEFARTGMPAGRLLNTFIMAKGMTNFAVRLGSNQVKGQKGAYHVPTVSVVQVQETDLDRAREFVTA